MTAYDDTCRAYELARRGRNAARKEHDHATAGRFAGEMKAHRANAIAAMAERGKALVQADEAELAERVA